MTHLYTARNPQSSARRQQVHGWLQPLEDDTRWSCIHTGLSSMVVIVWGIAAMIAAFVMGN